MSKKTKTELEILSTVYAKTPTPENAAELIKILRDALETSEKDRDSLEKDMRMLELAFSQKTDCERKKP
jgi:Mg2+/Co2+ transporter CorC